MIRKRHGLRLPRRAGVGRHTTEPNLRSYHAGSPGRAKAALIPGYDNAGVMSEAALAAYPCIVKRMPGIPLAASGARAAAHAVARRAWHGLVQVLIGPDPPSVWRWRSPQQRRTAYAALGVTTLALCAADLVGIATPGQLLLAVPVVAPLPLSAWYPMLSWRIGWLALLLAPLVPAAWWGGWPWAPGQILALLGAFCLAGIRQQRTELWWMWALTLIPWWLWLAADVPDLNGNRRPAGGRPSGAARRTPRSAPSQSRSESGQRPCISDLVRFLVTMTDHGAWPPAEPLTLTRGVPGADFVRATKIVAAIMRHADHSVPQMCCQHHDGTGACAATARGSQR